ncbi:MAG: APC family permease [Ignavibacteria bacterium]|jgi:fructoselysine transporter
MLRRELSFVQATAINMIDMVGIGPFVTTALVAATMGSVHLAIMAWVVGLVFCLIDASVWSELGAKFPDAGGSYRFLREAYGHSTWGRYFSFLFIWQTVFTAPLVIASGALGFASYAQFFLAGVPQSGPTLVSRVIAIGVIVILTFLLYRRISDVGRISVALWICVVTTMVLIIITGFVYGSPLTVMNDVMLPVGGWSLSITDEHMWTALGVATIPTMYSYLGYYNVCHLGAEVTSPERLIPRSMYVSIAGIGALYLLMQVAVFASLPIESIKQSKFVVSDMIAAALGHNIAVVATVLILVIAMASLFSVMLGYSRVPYAAAQDGLFFNAFGKLHPSQSFPHVALLVLAGLAMFFAATLTISDAIKSIVTMRVFTQFIAQAAGLMILRKRIGWQAMPWRMWMYPVPALLTIVLWLWIFSSAKPLQQIMGVVAPVVGTIVFVAVSYSRKTWPFTGAED